MMQKANTAHHPEKTIHMAKKDWSSLREEYKMALNEEEHLFLETLVGIVCQSSSPVYDVNMCKIVSTLHHPTRHAPHPPGLGQRSLRVGWHNLSEDIACGMV